MPMNELSESAMRWMGEEYLNDEEKRRLGNLLRSHPKFGQRSLTIAQCLDHPEISYGVKASYVNFMNMRYPTSTFGFVIGASEVR